MNPDVVQQLGQVAGIAGVCAGIFLVITFRIVGQLGNGQAHPELHKLLRLAMVQTWSIAVLGIAAWTLPDFLPPPGPLDIPPMSPEARADPRTPLAAFEYDGGRFVRNGSYWIEYKDDSSDPYTVFAALRQDDDAIYLVNRRWNGNEFRNFLLRLPMNGGDATWSWDSPKEWKPLYRVKPLIARTTIRRSR